MSLARPVVLAEVVLVALALVALVVLAAVARRRDRLPDAVRVLRGRSSCGPAHGSGDGRTAGGAADAPGGAAAANGTEYRTDEGRVRTVTVGRGNAIELPEDGSDG